MRRGLLGTTLLALVLGVSAPAGAEGAPTTDVKLAFPASGVAGAWLVAGPFRAGKPALDAPPQGLGDDRKLLASSGALLGDERDLGTKRKPPARWSIAMSGGQTQDPGSDGSRSIDLRGVLEDASGRDLVAYAAGRFHVAAAGRYFLLLGVDDGVRVSVDGNVLLVRDTARPLRDDDDVIPLDLDAGDHDIVLKLHQHDGAWGFRAKLVDAKLAPAPGSWLGLPGTTTDDAKALAASMSWLVVERAFEGGRYRPTVVVRYPEGAPRDVTIGIGVKVPGSGGFELDAGGVAVTAAGVRDVRVTLPPLDPGTAARTIEVTVAGRVITSTLPAWPEVEHALMRVERALGKVDDTAPWLVPGSIDSVRYLAKRLGRYVAHGDGDGEALLEEAKDLERLAASLEAGRDPYEDRTGPSRRALVTPFDGAPSEFGIYVPLGFKRGEPRSYPLVVGLHGMNSYPMSIMRALFGLDDAQREAAWKDRHAVPLPPVDAFVLTPNAHGNSMYREIGEDDVLQVMRWVTSVYPIDETRITITGPSMGGIGAASVPFHYPGIFAAAEPLCGYHSYLIRPEIMTRPRKPWETALLEERSNVLWAENGEHLPLYIAHGTRDLPEANSGVLIERYEKLGYSVRHEHPDVGHNVWGPTYADLKGMKWLLDKRLDPHPSHVRFRTLRSRYDTSAWVKVDALERELAWGDVDARIASRKRVVATTSGIGALTFARDPRLLDAGPVAVAIDGGAIVFDEGELLALRREGKIWQKANVSTNEHRKAGHVTGPFHDVFHEPLLFVYAADDEARANERVARHFAERPGITTGYTIISDLDFQARGEAVANDRALFLVGRNNRVLAGLGALPIRVESGAVTVGTQRITGRELGAAFVYPNPLRLDRYVAVVAGADIAGTLRAISLPELLPDFIVWDETIAPARGQLLLGGAPTRAAGLFGNDWSLP